MQGDYVLLLTLIFSFLLFLIQRTERKARFWVAVLILITAGILLNNFVRYRSLESEGLTALVLALLINFFYWFLIGRYNPVKNSDESIKVIGMDD